MMEALYKLTRYRMTWYVSGVIDTLLILLLIWALV